MILPRDGAQLPADAGEPNGVLSNVAKQTTQLAPVKRRIVIVDDHPLVRRG